MIDEPLRDDYDPNRNTPDLYDDRDDPLDEVEFTVEEELSRNIGFSGRDPADAGLVL